MRRQRAGTTEKEDSGFCIRTARFLPCPILDTRKYRQCIWLGRLVRLLSRPLILKVAQKQPFNHKPRSRLLDDLQIDLACSNAESERSQDQVTEQNFCLQCDPNDAVDAVVTYLQRKLRIKFAVPNFQPRGDKGILDIDTSINHLIHDLRERRIGGIYLPNTRWFAVSSGR